MLVAGNLTMEDTERGRIRNDFTDVFRPIFDDFVGYEMARLRNDWISDHVEGAKIPGSSLKNQEYGLYFPCGSRKLTSKWSYIYTQYNKEQLN